MEDGYFKKGLWPDGRLARYGPGYRPRNSSAACGLCFSAILPWFCHQHHSSRTWEESSLPIPWVISPQTSVWALDPQVTYDPVPAPPDHAGGKPAELSSSIDFKMALYLGSNSEPVFKQSC